MAGRSRAAYSNELLLKNRMSSIRCSFLALSGWTGQTIHSTSSVLCINSPHYLKRRKRICKILHDAGHLFKRQNPGRSRSSERRRLSAHPCTPAALPNENKGWWGAPSGTGRRSGRPGSAGRRSAAAPRPLRCRWDTETKPPDPPCAPGRPGR